jgi:hypothetical protein
MVAASCALSVCHPGGTAGDYFGVLTAEEVPGVPAVLVRYPLFCPQTIPIIRPNGLKVQ